MLTPGMGSGQTWALIEKFGSAAAAVGSSGAALEAAGVEPGMATQLMCGPARDRAAAELRLADRYQIQFVLGERRNTMGELVARAPKGAPVICRELQEIDLPPVLLWCRGCIEWMSKPALRIAIVGARTPTPYGLQEAARFAAELAAAGAVIVSGFARGIDREAHRATLDAGGKTVAVLGSGLANPYPADRMDLFESIARDGTVVSEFPMQMHGARQNFPRRNRILAGMSHATIVIEAGLASGSLITASWAADFGRPVFAVPGRIDSPMSAGCHDFIQKGTGILCTSPREVLERLGHGPEGGGVAAAQLELQPEEHTVLEAAGAGATLDEMARRFPGAEDRLLATVSGLEIAGLLERAPGGLYRSVLPLRARGR